MEAVDAVGIGPLFGQARSLWRLDFVLPLLALIGSLALGLWIIWRWRTGFAKEEPASLGEQVRHYQDLVDRGELDPEEFERIKAQLEQQAGRDVDDPPST